MRNSLKQVKRRPHVLPQLLLSITILQILLTLFYVFHGIVVVDLANHHALPMNPKPKFPFKKKHNDNNANLEDDSNDDDDHPHHHHHHHDHHPPPVRFRPFTGNVKNHNQTIITGQTIPGSFLFHHIFLIGARLSTSCIPSNTDVFVDVFGFPGDWLLDIGHENKQQIDNNKTITTINKKEKKKKQWCNRTTIPQNNRFVTNAQFFANRAALYCQLECEDSKDNSKNFTVLDETQLCGEPIRMTLIPLYSGDINQDETTLIWRCNVSQYLKKSQLIQKHTLNPQQSVRVRLDLQVLHTANNSIKPPTMHHVTTFDIPLHTAVIGHGGPQIRSKNMGYFSMQQPLFKGTSSTTTTITTRPMEVGLCLAIYGNDALRFLPEFVQHHKNIGISQIAVGLETEMDSQLLHHAEKVLEPFIEEGFVVLQATSLNAHFTCESDMAKLHFYHQCLYHFKGLAKYIATWDLDEYWIPPKTLNLGGGTPIKFEVPSWELFYETFPHQKVKKTVLVSNRNHVQSDLMEKSNHSAFSHLVTNDPIWQASNYSKSISIQDVMRAIEMFYKQHGCDNKWCYHLFPSFFSYMKDNATRTFRIRDDFYQRTTKSVASFKKSITQTQFAMMGGIHLPGSCKYPKDPEYYEFSQQVQCFPHLMPWGEFGRMHHYQSLILFRDHWDVVNRSEWIEDEYIVMFAETVYKQLDMIRKFQNVKPQR